MFEPALIIIFYMLNRTNYKNTSPLIASEQRKQLSEMLAETQTIALKALSSWQVLKQTLQQGKTVASSAVFQEQEEESAEGHSLLEGSEELLTKEVIIALNGVLKDAPRIKERQRLFIRNLHKKRRAESSKGKNKEMFLELPLSQTDCYSLVLANSAIGQSVKLDFNQCELDSLKAGPIQPSIVFSYISMLRIARIIPFKTLVLPLDFLQKLMGCHFNSVSCKDEELSYHIQKVIPSIHSEINQNILCFEYLIIPTLIEDQYKCIIVQNVHQLILNLKTNIIFCNFRTKDCAVIGKAIRMFLLLCLHPNKNPLLSNKQIPQICLMVPREANRRDSGIYLMLYLEFLFSKKQLDVQKIRMVQNKKKLHLFPRCLAHSSRAQIWNLLISLSLETNSSMRTTMCVKFVERRVYFCMQAVLEEFDRIEGRQLQKYLIVRGCQTSKTDEAKQFENEMNFYLDRELNYYLNQSLS